MHDPPEIARLRPVARRAGAVTILPGMPRAASVLRLAFGALAVADTVLAGMPGPAPERARLVTKSLLMPTLAGSFAIDPRSRRTPLRRSTQAGQALGWLGDLALLGSGTGSFLAGMGAFGAGQIAYIRGFRANANPNPLRHSTVGKGAAGLFLLTGIPMALGAARSEPVLGPGVLAYAGLLTTMADCAAHLDPALPEDARRAAALGGLAFLTSDTLLGLGHFVLSDPPPILESAVMATYTAAQFLLAEGALRAAGQSAE